MSNMKRLLALLIALGWWQSGITAEAIFAGGCFWCVEADMEQVPGVTAVDSGYTGGTVQDPTYEQVSAGTTGHYEAVRVVFDPEQVTYRQLLDVFWRNIDPFDSGGQFCDRGSSYRSAIFVAGAEQRREAEASRNGFQLQLGPEARIVTPIVNTGEFYPAEEYHQDYYRKNPLRYKYYRFGCGRDQRLQEIRASAKVP